MQLNGVIDLFLTIQFNMSFFAYSLNVHQFYLINR